ncbi:MAG: sugar kinase [Euryarchaeota archaeon]|jgi:NAD+ kinase|nr:sugar kinase [Euryarchaeota archaeon]
MDLLETLSHIADAAEQALAKVPSLERGCCLGLGADGTDTSQIDKVAENAILDYITRHGVPLNVLSEEIGYVDNGAEDVLVLDPVDGTTNALAEVPFYAISLAVGRGSLAGMHTAYLRNPVTGDVYTAEKGKGAFKNGCRIRVREDPDLDGLLLAVYLGNGAHPDSFSLVKRTHSTRAYGCASLEMALVAEGHADGYVMNSENYSRSIRVIDIAASLLILREAGGEAFDLEGNLLDMPLNLDVHANLVAFGDKKVYDFIMRKGKPRDLVRYGICTNIEVPSAQEYTRHVMDILKDEEIVLDEPIATELGLNGSPLDEMKVDVMLTIGGDGTVLRALNNNPAPLIGINAGGVGFLADIDVKDMRKGIDKLRRGDYTIEERARIAVRYEGSHLADAVNEVVVHTDTIAKIRHFKVYVDDHLMTEVRADGIIVATPTGSTCYAMSLGAPIIDPNVNGMVVVPMAAYKFASRPFVVPMGSKVTVESMTDRGCIIVTDGQEEFKMAGKSSVDISLSGRRSRFIRFDRDFYKRVRDKLVNTI